MYGEILVDETENHYWGLIRHPEDPKPVPLELRPFTASTSLALKVASYKCLAGSSSLVFIKELLSYVERPLWYQIQFKTLKHVDKNVSIHRFYWKSSVAGFRLALRLAGTRVSGFHPGEVRKPVHTVQCTVRTFFCM